ncbi:uncharacterized protein B0I36DRAFT_369394 [Microdochium trichocladiopsis]|uniref:Uncharacterized protein n=1 Tax=Microdochium trichocladiopsis TaxID=1682393 RepID=A0A9P8XS72_9PEZI|nr:uncharacterized protein B0I36DRAFT_369394 [Microdochium trichocladiopsis]KAH7014437.1 hypothetical protein B0I36DRAFT_369394 [Microdochium trichocladiopsis]
MNRPVPVTQKRPPATFRPPPLRHETDSSNSEVEEQQPNNNTGYFSPSTNSGSRPSSLPLPPLQQSAFLRPPLVSPRELLNPMSIASALADTAADMPPRGSTSSSAAPGGQPYHGRPSVSSGSQTDHSTASRSSSYNSYSAPYLHRRSSSVSSPYYRSSSQQQQSPHGHYQAPYQADSGPAGSGGNSAGRNPVDDDTRHIVERLRAMDQSLREATQAQRRLIDETMLNWRSDDNK